jgi:23S rRNA pseudouridine2605 synthase
MSVRLQKALAEAGLGSRRACERLIAEGRVTVDGAVAALGTVVDPVRQVICVDGRPLSFEPKEYWLLNKPKGVLSTARDERGRRTVVDLVPSRVRLYPVGRLDRDTTGVLLLTNDGELTARLLHPRHHVPKEYLVTVAGQVTAADQARLEQGVVLEEGPTAPAAVRMVRQDRRGGRATTVLSLVLHEGRKRQVRRMMEALGYPVLSLHRTCFAGLSDAGLGPGEARQLSGEEVESLRRAAGLR